MFLFFCCLPGLVDARQSSLEHKVKAAYLYNFTKFISWPEKQSDTFNICILGQDSLAELLEPLEKRTVLEKPIRLHRYQSIKQLQHCHILYLDGEESHKLAQLKLSLSEGLIRSLEGTLTVSSQPLFARHGGMIGFVIREGRVKLQINLQVLKQNGFTVSAKLMEVAELVEGDDNE